MKSLSFVLPAFDEAHNIAEAIRRCVAVGERLRVPFEVIVVDDGSRDATRFIADRFAEDDRRVRTLHHPRNRGYGAALRSGLLAARMDRVFFTDADLQFDVDEIDALLHHAEDYDVVVGYRSPRRDSLGRIALGWGWSRLVNALFDLDVRDVDCAFKVFDRAVIERIAIQSVGALVNTEILVRARGAGFRIHQVPVRHLPRRAGTATGATPRVMWKAFSELLALHADLRAVSRTPRSERASSRR